MLTPRLRHRITIEDRYTEQNSETGEMATYWDAAWVDGVPLDSVPAEVLTGPGKERYAAGTKQAETTARITIRWFPGLKPSWRIVWDGKIYDIASIETDATGRREYRLNCVDGPSEGL